MNNHEVQRAFDALKHSDGHQPLLNENEITALLSERKTAKPTFTARRVGVLSMLFLVSAFTFWMLTETTQPVAEKSASVALKSSPVVESSSNLIVESPNISVEASKTPRYNNHARIQTPSQMVAQELVPGPQAPEPSATIAGVQYLNLTQTEFDALPRGVVAEVVTQRVRSKDVDGNATDRRSIECLLPSADSPNVTYNGEEFVQRRALYIPVRVLQVKENQNTETIAWYKPTSMLITFLPERYRVPLMLELNLLTEVQRGCMSPAEACKSLPHSQSYFDMCRLDAASVKSVMVTPNPAHLAGTVALDLSRATTLNVGLFTSSGNFVTDLTSREQYSAGKHELPVRFDGVAAGLYLLTITTTNGEHVVRQIIIE